MPGVLWGAGGGEKKNPASVTAIEESRSPENGAQVTVMVTRLGFWKHNHLCGDSAQNSTLKWTKWPEQILSWEKWTWETYPGREYHLASIIP